MLFLQMPSSWPHHEGRFFRSQLIFFPFGAFVLNRTGDRIPQIQLPFNVVPPGRGICVLEIRHKDLCPRIQPVDNHFPVHWTCDFHAPIHQIRRNRRSHPLCGAYFACFFRKVQHRSGINCFLPLPSRCQNFLPPSLECVRQFQQKSACAVSQNLFATLRHVRFDFGNLRCLHRRSFQFSCLTLRISFRFPSPPGRFWTLVRFGL